MAEIQEGERGDSVASTYRWRWCISPWRSKKSRWGVEVRRRPLFKHSQVRVHLGHRHFTLMAKVVGKVDRP